MGKDFLALPKPHHHVSRLLVLVIILALLILAGWLYIYLQPENVPAIPPAMTADDIKRAQLEAAAYNPQTVMTPEEVETKKSQLQVSKANPKTDMTPEEIAAKQAILDSVSEI